MTSKSLENAVLKLPMAERARIASRLLSSLDQDDPAEIDRLWGIEAQRRYRAYRRGKMKAYPAHEAIASLKAALRK